MEGLFARIRELPSFATALNESFCEVRSGCGSIPVKMSSTEAQLLRRYARDCDEAAFTELVSRHGNLVYSAALRQTGGNVDVAKEIVQKVFLQLAKKAASISEQVVLAGWLHRATVLAAAHIKRTEARRSRRKQRSMEIQEIGKAGDRDDWHEIAPVLDQLLGKLKAGDRDALLLRFFEGRSLKEVGQIIGCGETGASQRISRALEKLRSLLARRGVTCSAKVLSSHLSTHAIQIIPAGILSALAAASTLQAASGVSAFGLLSFMTTTKLKSAVIGAIIVAGITTPLFLQHKKVVNLRKANRSLQTQLEMVKSAPAQTRSPVKSTNPSADANFLELMRLRGEVGLLRSQVAEHSRSNTPAEAHTPSPQASPPALPTEPLRPGIFPAANWAEKGFSTPLNSAMTWLWAVRHGYAEQYSQSLGKTNILPFPIGWANALERIETTEMLESGLSEEGNPVVALSHQLSDGSSEKCWLTFRRDGDKWRVQRLTGYPIVVVSQTTPTR